MHLYISTEDFRIQGFPYSGLPIFITKDNDIFRELLDFTIFYFIERGRVASKGSWETYGRDLYDYFNFLEVNELSWKDIKSRAGSTLLALYRDVSMSQFGVSATTINRRLHIVCKFYRYAQDKGWIDTLPYKLENIIVRKHKGFLAHSDSSGSVRVSPHIMAKTVRPVVKVLNYTQIKALIDSIANRKIKLMTRFILSTGLRISELLTFPVNYIEQSIKTGYRTHVPVHLNPKDMKIKGNRSRTIMVPIKTMNEIWNYVIHDRQSLVHGSNEHSGRLFLNRDGVAYAENSKLLNNEFNKLNLPFHVTPHILRHTFATQLLKSLEEIKNKRFNSLIYVRDRLGHSSIETTMTYLHLIDQLDDDLNIEYQNEIDQMCDLISFEDMAVE